MKKYLFRSKNQSKHTLLLYTFILLIVALFFSSFTTISNYVIYPIFVLWIPYLLGANYVLSNDERTFYSISILYIVLVLVYWAFGYSSISILELLRTINWIMTGVIAVYTLKTFSERELHNVYLVITISIFFLIWAFIKSGEDLAAMEDQNEAALVANAWYGSLFMLFTGLSLIVLMHVKSWHIKIIAVVGLLLSVYLNVYILQRGTNIIFTIAETGLILLMTLKSKAWVYSFSIIIIVSTIYIYVSGSLIGVFDWLADVIPSDRLAIRFREISAALKYEDFEASSGSLSARNRLIGTSWNTFTSNIGYFVFGAGEHTNNNTIIGHHSFFFDTLARYGIIGGTLMFVYFKKQYQIIMSVLDKKADWALYMQCAVVFLFYILRNIYGIIATGLANLIILAYFPMTLQIVRYYNNKKNKTKIH